MIIAIRNPSLPPVNPAALRAEFPVLERVAYLNTGTNGPVPRRGIEAALGMMRSQLEEGRGDPRFFEQILSLAVALRGRVANLLGCDPDELALTHSTTDGVNTVLAGLSLGPGDEVLTGDEEHPGLLAPLALARERCGFELRIVPFAEIADAAGPRTKLVATCHISWVTGEVLDTAAIDAPLLLDGAQGLGAVPVDVRALGCDFYAASGQKWLCGPLGTGYLYVRRDLLDQLAVTRVGFPSLADPRRALDAEWQAGSARFVSEVPVPHQLSWSLAALDVLEDFGIDRLHARATDLADSLAGRLRERGHEVAARGRSTLVSWAADDPEAETERLAEQGFVVRYLPGTPWVRASVGAWSSEEELESLAAAAAG
jgi:selenocysteine lyase/cysteine desulfurase